MSKATTMDISALVDAMQRRAKTSDMWFQEGHSSHLQLVKPPQLRPHTYRPEKGHILCALPNPLASS